jgi:hypothetical protein
VAIEWLTLRSLEKKIRATWPKNAQTAALRPSSQRTLEDAMQSYSGSLWKIWTLTGAGTAALLLGLVAACSIDAGETSEIDSYDLAVQTQSVTAARAFVKQYRTSHLIGDLIESLPPDVALQVCGDLPVETAGKAARSCSQLQDTIATEPAAPNGPAQIAASASIVMPIASSDCVGTPLVVQPTGSTSMTKAMRTASVPTRKRSKQTQRYLLIASAERGSKETRN